MANIHIDRIMKQDTITMPRPHSHKHYELYFLLSGKRTYLFDDVSFNVFPRSIVVVPPNLLHMTGGGDFERTLIRVFPQALTAYQESVLNELIAQKAYQISPSTWETINGCFQQMFALTENEPYYDDKMFALFSYVLYLLEKDFKELPPPPLHN